MNKELIERIALQAKVAELTSESEYYRVNRDISSHAYLGMLRQRNELVTKLAEQGAEIERLTEAVRYRAKSHEINCGLLADKNKALAERDATIAQQAERIAELERERDEAIAHDREAVRVRNSAIRENNETRLSLTRRVAEQSALIEKCEKGLVAVEWLIVESSGVVGLHLNGNTAPWASIRTGGFFESWLEPFDEALAAIALHQKGNL